MGGPAADADLSARERDLVIAGGAVVLWREADAACSLGFEQMTASRQAALTAVDEVRAAGFEVADDYTVTDTTTGATAEQRQARQAQAEAHRNFIRARVALMVGYDREIATKMDAALGGLTDITFDEPSRFDEGQPVDFAPLSRFTPLPDLSFVWCVAQVSGFLCTQYFQDGSTFVYPSPTDRSGVVTQHGP